MLAVIYRAPSPRSVPTTADTLRAEVETSGYAFALLVVTAGYLTFFARPFDPSVMGPLAGWLLVAMTSVAALAACVRWTVTGVRLFFRERAADTGEDDRGG